MPETIDYERRRMLGAAVMGLAVARVGMAADARATGTRRSFGLPQEAPQAFAKAVVEADGYGHS